MKTSPDNSVCEGSNRRDIMWQIFCPAISVLLLCLQRRRSLLIHVNSSFTWPRSAYYVLVYYHWLKTHCVYLLLSIFASISTADANFYAIYSEGLFVYFFYTPSVTNANTIAVVQCVFAWLTATRRGRHARLRSESPAEACRWRPAARLRPNAAGRGATDNWRWGQK